MNKLNKYASVAFLGLTLVMLDGGLAKASNSPNFQSNQNYKVTYTMERSGRFVQKLVSGEEARKLYDNFKAGAELSEGKIKNFDYSAEGKPIGLANTTQGVPSVEKNLAVAPSPAPAVAPSPAPAVAPSPAPVVAASPAPSPAPEPVAVPSPAPKGSVKVTPVSNIKNCDREISFGVNSQFNEMVKALNPSLKSHTFAELVKVGDFNYYWTIKIEPYKSEKKLSQATKTQKTINQLVDEPETWGGMTYKNKWSLIARNGNECKYVLKPDTMVRNYKYGYLTLSKPVVEN